jgi:hypothetical protein
MKSSLLCALLALSLSLIASGCGQDNAPPVDKEAKIKASLDELDPADRKLAQEQKYCAVETEKRLGTMGKPIKVMVKDQPVFLCCKSCEKKAQQDPDKTLAVVKELKSENAPKEKEKNHESHEKHE